MFVVPQLVRYRRNCLLVFPNASISSQYTRHSNNFVFLLREYVGCININNC